MAQQPTELTLILSKLDALHAAIESQDVAQRALAGRLDDTNARLDVTNIKMDHLSRELHAALTQWKRLGVETAELKGDVEELTRTVHETPIPPRYIGIAGQSGRDDY
jgi:hypothetical protein